MFYKCRAKMAPVLLHKLWVRYMQAKYNFMFQFEDKGSDYFAKPLITSIKYIEKYREVDDLSSIY